MKNKRISVFVLTALICLTVKASTPEEDLASNKIWPENPALGYALKHGKSAEDVKLPFQDQFDFNSAEYSDGWKYRRDVFAWRLVPLAKNCGLGLFISSEYPITPNGPRIDVKSAGIALSWNFR